MPAPPWSGRWTCEPRLIAGQGKGANRAWSDNAMSATKLFEGGVVDLSAGHGHPFNDQSSCDGDPSKENGGRPDRGGGCHPHPAPWRTGRDDGGDRIPEGGGGFGAGADGANGSPVPVEDDPGGCGLWVVAGVGSALVGGVRYCEGVPPGAESRAVFPLPFPPPLLVGVVVVGGAGLRVCGGDILAQLHPDRGCGRKTGSGSRANRCGTWPESPRSSCSASARFGFGSALGGRGVRVPGFVGCFRYYCCHRCHCCCRLYPVVGCPADGSVAG